MLGFELWSPLCCSSKCSTATRCIRLFLVIVVVGVSPVAMVTPLTGSGAAESRGQWRDARIPPTGVIKQCKVDTARVWDSKRKACIDAMRMYSATAVVKKTQYLFHCKILKEENGCVHSHTLSFLWLKEPGGWRIWLFRAEQIRLARMTDIPAVEGSCYQRGLEQGSDGQCKQSISKPLHLPPLNSPV